MSEKESVENTAIKNSIYAIDKESQYDQKKENSMHQLLGTLFSDKLSAEEKICILKNEYHIPMEEKLKGGLYIMCNLSQGIKEKGRLEGEERSMSLIEKLIDSGRLEDCQRVTKDTAYRRQLMQELGI